MAYVRFEDDVTEYQGESFNRTLRKKDGSTWGATESATYSMIDKDGTEVDSGSLTKSGDSLGLVLVVSKTVTASLQGKYTVLVSLVDSADTDYSDVIAKYEITYTDSLGNSV